MVPKASSYLQVLTLQQDLAASHVGTCDVPATRFHELTFGFRNFSENWGEPISEKGDLS